MNHFNYNNEKPSDNKNSQEHRMDAIEKKLHSLLNWLLLFKLQKMAWLLRELSRTNTLKN